MRFVLASVILLLTGCAMHHTPERSPAYDELRLMSFNVRFATADDGPNHWDLRQNALISAIKAFDPDILGTQETLLVQRDFIARKLPTLAAIGVGRDDGGDTGEMTAVFYRRDRFERLAAGHFWLSETPTVPGSKSWDTSLTRMATWLKLRDRRNPSARPVLVINTHFDHRGEIAREESAKLLRRQAEQLGDGCAIIILGDLNCHEDDPPYAQLANRTIDRETLLDSYRTVHVERKKDEATFTAFKPDATDGARIDYIFTTADLTPVSAAIDRNLYEGRMPSDHFPVWAIVRRAR